MDSSPSGFFILTRSFLQSELWLKSSPGLRSIIITFISKANHIDKQFNGVSIPRGSFVSSQRNLSAECKVDRRSLRRYIDSLIKAHFCAQQCAHSYSIITILKYNDLQNKESDYAPTFAPNNAPMVGANNTRNGYIPTPMVGANTATTNNEQNNLNNNIILNTLIKDVVKGFIKDITPAQIARYRKDFPWDERQFLKEGLVKGGYSDSDIGKVFEQVYKQQYTGKAV